MPRSPTPVDPDGDHEPTIRLDQVLKLLGVVTSGGQAKVLIQSGEVSVDGAVETRRGRKLRRGAVVTLASEPGVTYEVPQLRAES